MSSTNPCFLYMGIVLREGSGKLLPQERIAFRKKKKYTVKVFKFSKNRKNRILDPFAHPPDLTINILPHKLREKDTCKGGDSAAGSAGDSKETDSIPYLFSSVLYPYNGSSLFRLLGRHSSSLTRE